MKELWVQATVAEHRFNLKAEIVPASPASGKTASQERFRDGGTTRARLVPCGIA